MKLVAGFLLMLASCFAFGQSNYAELGGTVLDSERAAIVGATIQLTSVPASVIQKIAEAPAAK